MDRETVTVEVELSREVHERLSDHGSVADQLGVLAADEARLLEAVERYARGDGADGADGERRPASGSLVENPPPIGALLGFDATEVGPGRATVEMTAGPEHANPMGTLHGGVLCDLGDAAMGIAYASTLEEDESFTTLELDVKFLKPVWDGRLTATAEVLKRGRTVGLVECEVTDGEGAAVARLQSVCLILRGERAAGR
jgi:uncharacterized protein (TIGR00369 family)